MKRRLAAILAADVVGFSAMVQHDELSAIQTVKGHFAAFEAPISLHHGRIVKTMGDGFLAEFPSVVEAVSCASALLKLVQQRNENLPVSNQTVFRMGLHAGDILQDGDDILGDGVNIAARLESIATPGCLAISAKVYEDVVDRLDLEFVDQGLKELKNIQKPVHVYELQNDQTPMTRNLAEPALPDKPSIAVLPLQSLSNDSNDGFLADGLTEDLTTALSGVPWLFVIARNSSFSYKGLAVDIRQISKELGVRYVVEGSIRCAGERVRISAQLADCTDGRQIWAKKYDGTLDNVFDLQDQIASEVVKAIAPQIQLVEIQKSARKRPESLSSYDMYLNALGCLNGARITQAEEFLHKAIEIYPDYASAKAILSWCTTLKVAWQSSEEGEALRREGIRLCQEAIDSSQRDGETDAYAGYTLAFHGQDVERGMDLVTNAVELCPSFAWAWTSRSMLETFFGDPHKGTEFGEIALRLNPKDPLIFRTMLALTNADAAKGDYLRALERAREGLRYSSNIVGLMMYQVYALANLNRHEEAKETAARLMLRHPDFRVSRLTFHTSKFTNLPDVTQDLLDCGLPN